MGTQGLVRLSADHRDVLAAFLEIEHDLESNFEGHWKPRRLPSSRYFHTGACLGLQPDVI